MTEQRFSPSDDNMWVETEIELNLPKLQKGASVVCVINNHIHKAKVIGTREWACVEDAEFGVTGKTKIQYKVSYSNKTHVLTTWLPSNQVYANFEVLAESAQGHLFA